MLFLSVTFRGKSIFLFQKRLFKSMIVGDISTVMRLQKVILQSNSARLYAIRLVTQVCSYKKFSGVDGKTSLTFLERFELNENLKANFAAWVPQKFKILTLFRVDGDPTFLQVSTISDRVWQVLISFSLQPVYEAIFHPRSFGFRSIHSSYLVQDFLLRSLGFSALGFQKRVIKLDLNAVLRFYNRNYLLENLFLPRSIKLTVNRFFYNGLLLNFYSPEKFSYSLINLLSNIMLHGIEDIQDGVRFGSDILFLLRPFDSEKDIYYLVRSFLKDKFFSYRGVSFQIFFASAGFDFLGWHFFISYKGNSLVIPSTSDYQSFLFRVKRIINNSNYGSNIKVSKLYPIIKQWRTYHRFSCLKGSRFSLYFIKKRAFKVFSKESRQDFFSTKRLVNRCFYFLGSFCSDSSRLEESSSPYLGHLIFASRSGFFDSCMFRCIHCGMKLFR